MAGIPMLRSSSLLFLSFLHAGFGAGARFLANFVAVILQSAARAAFREGFGSCDQVGCASSRLDHGFQMMILKSFQKQEQAVSRQIRTQKMHSTQEIQYEGKAAALRTVLCPENTLKGKDAGLGAGKSHYTGQGTRQQNPDKALIGTNSLHLQKCSTGQGKPFQASIPGHG